MTNLNKNYIVVGALALALIVGAYLYFGQGKTLSAKAAGEKAIAFINKSIQDRGATASLIEVADEGEVFRIHLKIEETEYDSYITKSGRFLFPSGFILEEQKLEEQEPVEQ